MTEKKIEEYSKQLEEIFSLWEHYIYYDESSGAFFLVIEWANNQWIKWHLWHWLNIVKTEEWLQKYLINKNQDEEKK